MKKLLTIILATLLCLTCLGFYGCETEEKPLDHVIPSEDTKTNGWETDVAYEKYMGVPILEVCDDGLYKAKFRESPLYDFDDHLDGIEFYLRLKNKLKPCKGDWVTIMFTGFTGETIDGLPVCETSNARILNMENATDKPVIYLYPTVPTEVSVKLTLDGHLTCTYPDYENGWDNFTAHPDGTLIFPDGLSPAGREYYCLYWEGIQNAEWDFSRGFCIKGSDTAAFLEWALAEQGLTPREANEFIIYWLPLMQENPYNVISFQTDAYTSTAVLDITPKPDSLLRICMAWYAADAEVEIPAQTFDSFEREGFVAVEWGGVEVKKP